MNQKDMDIQNVVIFSWLKQKICQSVVLQKLKLFVIIVAKNMKKPGIIIKNLLALKIVVKIANH